MQVVHKAYGPYPQDSGLPFPYETNPLCPDKELDLDRLGEAELATPRRLTGDLERDKLRFLNRELSFSGEMLLFGPRRDFSLSLI